MRFARVVRAAAVAAVTAAAVPALAAECYAIVDRTNQVVYQGLTSPIDLSDAGKPVRDAMRSRGEQLIAMDTEQCTPIDRARITGNGKPASVEEIVAGMRSAIPFGRAGVTAATSSAANGITLPRITVPVETGGPMSVGGPVSGMPLR